MHNNLNKFYHDDDGLRASYRCGMCGKTIGKVEINESGLELDKEMATALSRKTMIDNCYVCDDCYDMMKHISNYIRNIKEQ